MYTPKVHSSLEKQNVYLQNKEQRATNISKEQQNPEERERNIYKGGKEGKRKRKRKEQRIKSK